MRVLVACEESQAVTLAFRNKGHEAFSCDVLRASGGHPEWHIQDDVRTVLHDQWDMILAFPPCTDLCASGARWWKAKQASGAQQASIDFFLMFTEVDCPKVAIENPVGIMSKTYRKPDQIIQPWQHGHGETKATCLWLKGLPLLKPSCIVDGRESRIHAMPQTAQRSMLRSKTYQGIAYAMAAQWGGNDGQRGES